MTMATLENEIVAQLRTITGNAKITKGWLVEWQTGSDGDMKPQDEGEHVVYIPELMINACIKKPTPKPKK